MPPKQTDCYTSGAGASADINVFHNSFLEKDTIRYEEFAQLWKDKKMVYMLAGQMKNNDLLEVLDILYSESLNVFFSNEKFLSKACGIYMMYAFYEMQFFQPRHRIRVTVPQYKKLLSFIEEMKEKSHHDLVYVFLRLRIQRAFLLFATTTEQGLSYQRSLVQINRKGGPQSTRLPTSLVTQPDILSMSTVEEMQAIDSEYRKMKTEASNPGGETPHCSLDLVKADTVQEVTKTMARFDQWRKSGKLPKKNSQRIGNRNKPTKTRSGGYASGATTSESDPEVYSDSELSAGDQTDQDTIGDKRAKARKKAFTTTAESTRSTRYRKLVAAGSSQSDTPLSPPHEAAKKRPAAQKGIATESEIAATNEYLKTLTAPPKPKRRRKSKLKILSESSDD